MKDFKNNNSGMILLEFILYFPIVLIAFFAFILSSLMITQRVVLDRAVALTTASAANWMSTSLYRIGQPHPFLGTTTPATIRTNPYRGTINHFYPSTRAEVEERIKELVNHGANLGITGGLAGEVEIYVRYRNYLVAGDLTVTATQKIRFPINLSLIGITNTHIELNSSSSARIFRPLVNINDLHAVFDITRYFTRGAVDISGVSDFIGGIPTAVDNWFDTLTRGFGEPNQED